MSTPEPSAETRYVVVKREHNYRLNRQLVVGGALAIGLIIGVLIGYPLGHHLEQQVLEDAERLESTLLEAQTQIDSLRGELAVHKHGSDVERQVSEHLRKEIVELQSRLAAQERSIAFYKGILDPEKNQSLAIHALELTRTPVAGRFQYKLVLTQPLDSEADANGSIVLSVVGVQSGAKKVLDWKAIGEGKPTPGFKFKVYQDITGELKIPEAFIPEALSVRLVRAGSKTGESREYSWTVKETP